MHAFARIFVLVLFTTIMLVPSGVLTNDVSGDLIPDFFLELDQTIVRINSENDYNGTFDLTVQNQCIHSLRINVIIQCPGLSVSPEFTTIMVPPYASRTIPVAVAAIWGTAHSIRQVNIHAEVTQVDGISMTGKDREATVLAYIHRYQNFTMQVDPIEATRGEAQEFEIVLTNEGNDVDYATIDFLTNTDIQGYASIDILEIPAGVERRYPCVVTVPQDVPDDPEPLLFTIRSEVDPDLIINGSVVVEVSGDGRSISENSFGSVVSGILGITTLVLISLLFLTPPHSTRSHVQSITTVLLLIIGGTIISIPAPANAEIDVVAEGSITLRPSPFLDDESATETTTITISNSDIFDVGVMVTVNAPGLTFGYVREHRVPALQSTTFEVGSAVLKGSPYRHSGATIFAEVIEIEGVVFSGVYDAQAGFFVQTAPYSLPVPVPKDPVVSIEKNEPVTIDFEVHNQGNALDSFLFSVVNRAELEDHGLRIGNNTITENIDQSNSTIISIEIEQEEDLDHEFYHLRIEAESEIDGNSLGCTVILNPAEAVTDESQAPSSVIDSISPNPAEEGETVALKGHGTDDGSIEVYEWKSSIDGELSKGPDDDIYVSDLSVGEHTISLRVQDEQGVWSGVVIEHLTITEEPFKNSEPTVSITRPSSGEDVSLTILIEGTSSDSDGEVEAVEISLGGGPWIEIAGTYVWRYVWNTESVVNGPYTIATRSLDGSDHSDVASVNITIRNDVDTEDDGNEDDSLTTIPLPSFLALISIACFLAHRKQERR